MTIGFAQKQAVPGMQPVAIKYTLHNVGNAPASDVTLEDKNFDGAAEIGSSVKLSLSASVSFEDHLHNDACLMKLGYRIYCEHEVLVRKLLVCLH